MKKLSLWLVVLSMMTALLPQTFVSAAEAAWFDIEVENGAEKASHVVGDDGTGRRYMVANDGYQGHKSTVNFTREAAGTYDVYAVIGVDASDYIGGYTFTLDEEEFYSKSTEKANRDAVSDTLYTSIALAGGAHAKPMKWVKIAEDLEVAAGEHTIVSQVSQSTTQPNRMGAMDVVRFVPSSWNWVPDSNFDAPVKTKTYAKVPADGALLMEAEDGELSGEMAKISESKASNGAYAAVVEGADTGSTELAFKTTADEAYDIWAAIGTSDLAHLGGYTVTLDEDTVYDKTMDSISATNPDLYKKTVALAEDVTVRWVKLASAELEAGNHDLVISTKLAEIPINAAGLVDCVAIVPSEWAWDGNSSKLELPKNPSQGGGSDEGEEDDITYMTSENGIFWIESTDMNFDKNLWKTLTNGKASGENVIDYGSDSVTDPDPFAITVGLDVPEATLYDAYALVNNIAMHTSGWKFTLNNEDLVMSTVGSSVYNSGNSGFAGFNCNMTWVKIAELKDMAAGKYKLTMAPKISSSFSARILATLDCVVFIPSDMKYKLNVSGDAIELPGESHGRLCAEYVKKNCFSGDYTALTDKIELPETLPTFDGVTFSYGCDDEGAIDENGKVSRPYFNAEDLETNFNIIGTVKGKSGKAQIPVKILKNSKYTVSNFDMPDTLTANSAFDVSADVKVNAAADSGIGGKASLVVALYDANGALEDIAVYSSAVTTAGANLTAGITLPENVSGKSVKAYVINGFEMGNLLTETVSVR